MNGIIGIACTAAQRHDSSERRRTLVECGRVRRRMRLLQTLERDPRLRQARTPEGGSRHLAPHRRLVACASSAGADVPGERHGEGHCAAVRSYWMPADLLDRVRGDEEKLRQRCHRTWSATRSSSLPEGGVTLRSYVASERDGGVKLIVRRRRHWHRHSSRPEIPLLFDPSSKSIRDHVTQLRRVPAWVWQSAPARQADGAEQYAYRRGRHEAASSSVFTFVRREWWSIRRPDEPSAPAPPVRPSAPRQDKTVLLVEDNA